MPQSPFLGQTQCSERPARARSRSSGGGAQGARGAQRVSRALKQSSGRSYADDKFDANSGSACYSGSARTRYSTGLEGYSGYHCSPDNNNPAVVVTNSMNVVPGGPGSSGGSSTSSRSSRHKSPSTSGGSQSQSHHHHHHRHTRHHHRQHQHRVYHNVEHANEMIVIDYADGNVSSSQRHVASGSGGGSMGPPPLPPPNSNHAPPLPPFKRQPINLHELQSSVGSAGGMNVEVNLARYANHYQHYYQAHHAHSHGPETVVDGTVIHPHPVPHHALSARQYALPGDHHNAYYHNHHHGHGGNPHAQLYKPANRSSHSSDTSSAYSGSDTMQSIHSSLENEAVVDLSGLHESVVDSDEEELADGMGQMVIRDLVRECLEKDPGDRTAKDIEVLLEFSKTLEAFNNMTLATRRALCSVMVFAVVEKAGTVVMNHNEELDSWSVIINGEVRIDDPTFSGINNNNNNNNHTNSTLNNNNVPRSRSNNHVQYLKIGDSFGITATMDKLYHQGVMKTCMDDCQFVCITQNDYYKILKEEATNQRRYEENGQIVLVTDPDPNEKLGHKVIRGTPERLLLQLIDENSSTNESTYVEDFLLTHRTFLKSSLEVANKLLEWFNEGTLCDRVTRVLLLWVHNHFTDFETDPQMMEFLEKFEVALESRKKMNGQLRLLNFACAEKARKRIITLRRSSREEPLQFSLMGGYERGFGIFVERVEKNSKAAEIGLKRGDQILDVNRKSFENNMSLPRALTFLKESTHLELTVKSNLLGHVIIGKMKAPVEIPQPKSGKGSKKGHFKVHSIRGRSNSEYTVSSKSKRAHDDSSGSLKSNSSSSSMPITAMRSRDRVKAMLRSLIKPKIGFPVSLDHDVDLPNLGIASDNSNDSWDFTSDLPDHSLKIYRADQHFRYLLVHKNTSAREVVMLALQEFGISDCSSNFTLCEVTVEGNLVRQKRLPDEQTNLAERIGLASRYYIKNILSSEQLIPEDAKAELNKEAQVNILQLNAIEAAMQLMVEDFTIFRSIESTEHVDKLFDLESKFGTPNLDRFGDLVNREMMWVITEIVTEQNVNRRVKIIKQFIKVAHNCFKETQNYNSMFAITSGLDHGAVKRLKSTWEKVPSKYLKLLEEMRMVMEPSMNFRRYRNLVNSSKPPIIPIYPMVSKDLTFLHLGNETHIDGLINFEKLRMIAEKIRDLSNMCSTPLDVTSMLDKQGSQLGTALGNMVPNQGATIKRGTRGKSKDALNAKKMYEEAQMVRRVKAYLTKMPVIRDEERLHQLSVEVEPPPNPQPSLTVPNSASTGLGSSGGSVKALSAQNSTASINSLGNKPRRNHSPTPSIGSTNSSTSHQSYNSEGRKSTASGTKFAPNTPPKRKVSEPIKTYLNLQLISDTLKRKSKSSDAKLQHGIPPEKPKLGRTSSLDIPDVQVVKKERQKTLTNAPEIPQIQGNDKDQIEANLKPEESGFRSRSQTFTPGLEFKEWPGPKTDKSDLADWKKMRQLSAMVVQELHSKTAFSHANQQTNPYHTSISLELEREPVKPLAKIGTTEDTKGRNAFSEESKKAPHNRIGKSSFKVRTLPCDALAEFQKTNLQRRTSKVQRSIEAANYLLANFGINGPKFQHSRDMPKMKEEHEGFMDDSGGDDSDDDSNSDSLEDSLSECSEISSDLSLSDELAHLEASAIHQPTASHQWTNSRLSDNFDFDLDGNLALTNRDEFWPSVPLKRSGTLKKQNEEEEEHQPQIRPPLTNRIYQRSSSVSVGKSLLTQRAAKKS